MEAVVKFSGVNQHDLVKSKRGVINQHGNVAFYLCGVLGGDRLHELDGVFHLKRYSLVSTAIDRTKAEISKNLKFKQRVEKLKTVLNRQT